MITVITPFSRKENLDLLTKHLEGKCHWILLKANDEEIVTPPEWATVYQLKEGIDRTKGSVSNQLLNSFFNEADDETQYMVLCDDDAVENGFFDKIPDADVVCVSMQRNDYPSKHIVWDDWSSKMGHVEYGVDILYAHPDNMQVARVGGEQLICKGKILKQFKYGMEGSSSNLPGDFTFIRDVIQKYTPIYVPDAYVLFNYFEDGRFKSFNRKQL